MGKGFLKIDIFIGDHILPAKNAKILIKDTTGKLLYELTANENGISEKIALDAPDKKNSLDPYSTAQRCSLVDVEVPNVKGYKKVIIHGVQIFDEETSILPVQLHPFIEGDSPEKNTDEIFIPLEHGVDFNREAPINTNSDGFTSIMQVPSANEVKIPEYITVHLGTPNAYASNVRVPFIDYIKNVASSEIFPSWEEAAIYANIFCQISFALNRINTVWYRSRNYDFDITNSTAFDQYFVAGRNIFENISRIVDNIFNMFIRRQGRREPFFASYCNGTTSKCDGLSQWGSQELALKGYSYIQILRYYYPNDIQIVQSNNFVTNVQTYPGSPLKIGSSGNDVRTMQMYLNRISGNFYITPIPAVDGIFGTATQNTTMQFQAINNLSTDGIIGRNTWYRITQIYVGVRQLAELTSEGERIGLGAKPPNVVVQMGDRGEYVVELQFILNFISTFFPSIPFVIEDGVFRDGTKRSVTEFQKEFGLTQDGVVGPATWNKLYSVFMSIEDDVDIPNVPAYPQFPGTALRVGSSGSDVLLMQNYLTAISRHYPSIPSLTADGVFGGATQSAVIAFQRYFGLTPDGVIGRITWDRIVSVYNSLPYTPTTPPSFPGTALRVGSTGNDVRIMQTYLRSISEIFPVIPTLVADGIFGSGTQRSVIAFQNLFGLTPDGVIGKYTWDKIVSIYDNLPQVAPSPYPGTALRVGSQGSNVIVMQKFINNIARRYPSIPTVSTDGIFGPATENAVKAFQRQFGLTPDGIIGAITWNYIVSINNLVNMNIPYTYATPNSRNNIYDSNSTSLDETNTSSASAPSNETKQTNKQINETQTNEAQINETQNNETQTADLELNANHSNDIGGYNNANSRRGSIDTALAMILALNMLSQ